MTLLIVDDEARIRDLIRKYAAFEGYNVEEASNGMAAIEKCRQKNYDLIIMDVMMPVQGGREATRAIRAMDRPDAKTIPIFAMTANTFAADRKKCYDAGMSGYIPKPIDLETITHVLEEETGE